MADPALRLDLRAVTKTFGPARVLRSVDVGVVAGEVHALIGQNGCGKSTLIKILAGIYGADRGSTIYANGHALASPVRPADLRRAGVSIVHQDPGLIRNRTVLANIGVGDYRVSRFTRRINWAAEERIDSAVLAQLGCELDLNGDVESLDPARQSLVAAARALRRMPPEGGLIVLDETTKSLTSNELAEFYGALRRTVSSGGSVLVVSHNLEEVLRFADRVTVLRDGAVVAGGIPASSLTERDAARLMLGRDAGTIIRGTGVTTEGQPSVTVTGLTGSGVTDVDFEVRTGEVLGITGMAGDGWEEIPYLMSAATRARGGTLTVNDKAIDLAKSDIATLLEHHVALVPERRTADGIAVERSLADNIALPQVLRRGSWWRTGRSWVRQLASAGITQLDIRPPAPDQTVGRLSGGNQQKVLLAKWLGTDPWLFLLHEPTQAVDIGARHDILVALRDAAANGRCVVIASVQLADLVAVCDRVLVFRHGAIKAEIHDPTIDSLMQGVYSDDRPQAQTYPHDQETRGTKR